MRGAPTLHIPFAKGAWLLWLNFAPWLQPTWWILSLLTRSLTRIASGGPILAGVVGLLFSMHWTLGAFE